MDVSTRVLCALARGLVPGSRCRRGASLLYLVAVIAVVGALGVGVVQYFPRTLQTKTTEERGKRAYYLALSGQNLWPSVQSGLTNNTQYTYTIGNDKIMLTQAVDGTGNFTVTSQGVYSANTQFEANYRMVVANRTVDDIITLDNGFSTVHPENKNYAIAVFDKNQSSTPTGYNATTWASQYAANVNKYGGGTWLRIANDMTDSNGAIWYTGDYGVCSATPCPDGTCKGGNCGLGKGLRAVFSFVFNDVDSTSDSRGAADVMTFAIMTGAKNTSGTLINDPATACGGPPNNLSIGEYLGYAGTGPYGVGIKPPKIGIEVDTYPNGSGDLYDYRGSSSRWTPLSDSRNDYSNANHVAVVFWGITGSNDPKYADDNRHGAGGGTVSEPQNPLNGTTTSTYANGVGYYQVPKSGTYNWLEDAQRHTMRIEIHRTTLSNGTGSYNIKTWIVDGVPDSTDAYQNVRADYSGATPLLNYTVTLGSTLHTQLGQIYFGWTEGTGGATQNADIYGLKLYFVK